MSDKKAAPRAARMNPVLRLLLWVFGFALASLFVVTPLDLESQAILGAVMFAIALVVNRLRGFRITLALMVMSVAVSTRYLYWRLTATMDLYGGFTFSNGMAVVLFAAECYTFCVLVLGYVQSAYPLKRHPIPLPDNINQWPSVDVFIPSYNEPLDVVRPTVMAAKNMEWPADKVKVYILDDGRRNEFRDFARKAGVGYITRADNNHAKAGNINNCLARTNGEFVAIFDCDHVPTRSFLQMVMGWLVRDKKLAIVQTPHHFYSPDPFERNLGTFKRVPNEGELFYGLLQPGNDLWNAVFFCGSCAVIRRTALEEVGGIAVETVTEDAHTALKMHRRGWSTAFIDVPQASGLATETLSAHVGQRIRWARGMVQIFRIDNPLFGRGLTMAQRLCYTSAMFHFLFGVPRIIFLLAPLLFLFFGSHIFNAAPAMVIAYALPHLAHTTLTNSRVQGKFRHSYWAEVYETAISFYIAWPTTLALIRPSWGKFNVTAKGGINDDDFFDSKISSPFMFLIGLNAVGITLGVYNYIQGFAARDAVVINVFWALYNVGVLGATLAVAWERKQTRKHNRVDVKLPAILHHEGTGRAVACTTADLAMGGARLRGVNCAELVQDEPVTLSLVINHEELPLPARVLEIKGDGLRVSFNDLSLQEEEWLVRAMFGRANAWSDWHEEHEKDRPLRALTKVWGLAIRTIPRTIAHGIASIPRLGQSES